VETEFWRLFRRGGGAPHFVVTSEGARTDEDESVDESDPDA
jgi:hypothetical protein